MRKMIVGLAAVGGAVALSAVGAGNASAVPPGQTVHVAQHCIGLSPYVVDIPYSGGVDVSQSASGTASVKWGTPSLFGYWTHGTLGWTNLRTGASGSVPAHYAHNLAGMGFTATVTTGTGPVRFTTRAVNAADPLRMPAPVCSGVATIR